MVDIVYLILKIIVITCYYYRENQWPLLFQIPKYP